MSVTKGKVFGWYIATVVIALAPVGAFGLMGPWMVSQKDSLVVTLGVATYLVGLPVVGFALWSLIQSIMNASKGREEEEKQNEEE